MKKKAFTLMELMVAMGLLAIVMVMAGSIFRVALESYRVAKANAEIMQKLRVITSQLDRDLQGLCQQDQAFTVCLIQRDPNNPQGHSRFDRLVFFANGWFESYRQFPFRRGTTDANESVFGNLARISYGLASRGSAGPSSLRPVERILARTQHILTLDPNLDPAPDIRTLAAQNPDWRRWHNGYEYDKMSLSDWRRLSTKQKDDALSVITGLTVGQPDVPENLRGTIVDPCDANSIQMLLSEGVGDFTVQGWEEIETTQRWVPDCNDQQPEIQIWGLPGQGRALKFTFTLYDSRAIIKKGRTFTHIVDLGQ